MTQKNQQEKKAPSGVETKNPAGNKNKPAEKNSMTPAKEFRMQLKKYDAALTRLLADHGTSVEKFAMTIDNAIRQTPKLLEVDRRTLFGSVLTAAELGLEPNTPMGLSYLVPFKNQCQLIIGYQGVVTMLYRNERIQKIMTEVTRENDEFERWIGDDMNWHFKFKPAKGNRGKMDGAFAIIHLDKGEPLFTFMTMQELNEIKEVSQNPGRYDSKNDPQKWMYRKAVLKQCAKLAPKEKTIQKGLNLDGAIEGGATVSVDDDGKIIVNDAPQRKANNRPEDLKNIFGAGKEESEYTEYDEVE